VSLFEPGRSLKQDGCVRTKFIDDLTACAAGRAGHAVIVDHRDRANLDLGTELGNGGKDSRTLSAVGHSVGCVLHVAAWDNFSGREEDCGPDPEIRVGCVRVLHDLFRRPQQFGLLAGSQSLLGHKRDDPVLDGEIDGNCKPLAKQSSFLIGTRMREKVARRELAL